MRRLSVMIELERTHERETGDLLRELYQEQYKALYRELYAGKEE